jgi:predicted secreted hydrolase
MLEIISEDVSLNLVEPDIYSVYSIGDSPGAYDSMGVATIYDVVACNRFYNRLMWGYFIKDYATLCEDTLASSSDGWALDLACGSLAFTAEVYANCSNRPVVFLDQSLKLLRKGKSRLEKLKGNLSENMFFLHADALELPFKANIFHTVISFNLLHCLCLDDVKTSLKEIKRVLTGGVLGIAGEYRDNDTIRIFLKKWSTRIGPKVYQLKVISDPFSFDLDLTPVKPAAFHGKKGYSQKGSSPERASCYYSLTRLETKGQVTLAGKTFVVNGLSWMDHEFSTAPLEPGLVGWDWFGLQLSDNTEIMIYLLRYKDGTFNPASSGTYIRSNGKTKHLSRHDIEVTVTDTWNSPNSKTVYPARWRLRISSPAMDLMIAPNLADQEMRTKESTGVTYWEGSVSVRGIKNGRQINGQGYVELTGYAKSFDAPL